MKMEACQMATFVDMEQMTIYTHRLLWPVDQELVLVICWKEMLMIHDMVI